MTRVSEIFPTGSDEERERALEAATNAVRRGELVVFPTDTVYGLGCDAFDPAAVRALLASKGRGRDMPPPVLISAATTADALAVGLPGYARSLMEALWPGPLTLVARQQESLQWDLGETRGTVAIRMPDDELALALLERTGPLAVSSANTTGAPSAATAQDAEAMLGDDVSVYLDGDAARSAPASTIVDVTGERPRVLRPGGVDADRLDEVLEPLGITVVREEE